MSNENSNSKKGLLVLATLLLMVTSIGASYSCNVILPSVLTKMEAMDYYIVAQLSRQKSKIFIMN